MIGPASIDWHCLSSPIITSRKPCSCLQAQQIQPLPGAEQGHLVDHDDGLGVQHDSPFSTAWKNTLIALASSGLIPASIQSSACRQASAMPWTCRPCSCHAVTSGRMSVDFPAPAAPIMTPSFAALAEPMDRLELCLPCSLPVKSWPRPPTAASRRSGAGHRICPPPPIHAFSMNSFSCRSCRPVVTLRAACPAPAR